MLLRLPVRDEDGVKDAEALGVPVAGLDFVDVADGVMEGGVLEEQVGLEVLTALAEALLVAD